MSTRVAPLASLLRKSASFDWNKDCDEAFESIKDSLLRGPTLLAPKPNKPLILYVSHNEIALSAYLAQADELGKECPIYYLSRMMTSFERNYSKIEKACLALIFASQKLRHYFLSHEIYLMVWNDLVKVILTQPALSGRAVKWLVKLIEFDIKCVMQKAVKGQALADLLAIILDGQKKKNLNICLLS